MRQVIKAYSKAHDTDKETAYIFIYPKPKSGEAKLGYMPKKRSYGFVFSQFRSRTQIAQVITHEIGHGLFRLEHSFETYPSLSKGSTDNLMDYQEGNRLHKYQWDLIHNPIAMLGWFQDEGESAYYSVKEVQNLIDEIKKNNATTNTKLQTSRAIVTGEDLSDEAWLKANIQDNWLPANLIEDLTSDGTIRERLKNKPKYYGAAPTWSEVIVNPATDDHAVLLAKKVKVSIKEQTIPITIYGYAATTQIFTHYVAQHQIDDNTIIIFFNYIRPDVQQGELKSGKTWVYNVRKAFTITVTNANLPTLTQYLNFKGTIDLNESLKAESEDIIIDIVRKESNEFITTGEISVRGTNIKGATLELGRGTIKEECASCPTNIQYNCKRIPAGTYNFELNDDSQGGKLKYRHRAIRLFNTNGYVVGEHTSQRDGVLIHRGNSYSYSQGCILAMYTNKLPEILTDMDAYLNDNMMGYSVDQEERAVLPVAIYEYVERLDPDGTKKKTVIISNEDEGNVLNVDTEIFKNRQRAGQYYVKLSVPNEAENIINKLAYQLVEDLLKEKGVMKVVEDKKKELIAKKELSNEEKQKALSKAWDEKVQSLVTTISATEAKKKVADYYDNFVDQIKEYIIAEVIKDGRSQGEANNIYNYLSNPLTGPSSPALPLFKSYLRKVSTTPGSNVESKMKVLLEKNFTNYIKHIKDNFLI